MRSAFLWIVCLRNICAHCKHKSFTISYKCIIVCNSVSGFDRFSNLGNGSSALSRIRFCFTFRLLLPAYGKTTWFSPLKRLYWGNPWSMFCIDIVSLSWRFLVWASKIVILLHFHIWVLCFSVHLNCEVCGHHPSAYLYNETHFNVAINEVLSSFLAIWLAVYCSCWDYCWFPLAWTTIDHAHVTF